MNENERKWEPPTFTQVEWQALRSLVLKFIYYDVYSCLRVRCESIEESLKAKTPLSESTLKMLQSLGTHPAQLAEKLQVIKRHLAEDSPEALMHYYYDDTLAGNDWWYIAAKNSGFIKRP